MCNNQWKLPPVAKDALNFPVATLDLLSGEYGYLVVVWIDLFLTLETIVLCWRVCHLYCNRCVSFNISSYIQPLIYLISSGFRKKGEPVALKVHSRFYQKDYQLLEDTEEIQYIYALRQFLYFQILKLSNIFNWLLEHFF